jgi:hypothetical protein
VKQKKSGALRRIFFVIIFTNTATFFCLHSFGCRNTTALQTPTITNNVSIGACRAVTSWQPHTVAAAQTHQKRRPSKMKDAFLKKIIKTLAGNKKSCLSLQRNRLMVATW